MLDQRWVDRKVRATSRHAKSRVIRIAQNLGFPLWFAEIVSVSLLASLMDRHLHRFWLGGRVPCLYLPL